MPVLPPPHEDTQAEDGDTSNCLEAPSAKAKEPRKRLSRAQKREKMVEQELMLAGSEHYILNTFIVETHPEIKQPNRKLWSLGFAAWDSLMDVDKARFVDEVKQMRAQEFARQEEAYDEAKAESSTKKTTTKAKKPRKKLTTAQRREKMELKELTLAASEHYILNTFLVEYRKTHPEIRHPNRELWSQGNAAWDSLTDVDKARFVGEVEQRRAEEEARR